MPKFKINVGSLTFNKPLTSVNKPLNSCPVGIEIRDRKCASKKDVRTRGIWQYGHESRLSEHMNAGRGGLNWTSFMDRPRTVSYS